MTTTYCDPADLLIGRLQGRMPVTINVEDFIDNATREVNSKLGPIYVVPLKLSGTDALPEWQADLIKNITAKLASGQIIMAAAVGQEQNSVHQYGLWLVKQAEMELMAIANGDVRLTAVRVDYDGTPLPDPVSPEVEDPLAFIPGSSNRDAVSGVEAFEDNFMRTPTAWPGYPNPWEPGGGR